MTIPFRLLNIAAQYGRLLLVVGLVCGVLFPQLALRIKPWVPELISLLLFLSALRIGPRKALGAVNDLPLSMGVVLVSQLLLPLVAISIFYAFHLSGTTAALALVLTLSAPSVFGNPNFTVMVGHDPAPALRILIVGVALVPLTVILPFSFLSALGSAKAVFSATLWLIGVIVCTVGAAFLVRWVLFNRQQNTTQDQPSEGFISALDGCSAIILAIVVIGLMSAVGPSLSETPKQFALWLALVFAINFGLQVVSFMLLGNRRFKTERAAISIIMGNRNIGLFLIALPESITDPLLLYIGCYQFPMYLTPWLLHKLYNRHSRR